MVTLVDLPLYHFLRGFASFLGPESLLKAFVTVPYKFVPVLLVLVRLKSTGPVSTGLVFVLVADPETHSGAATSVKLREINSSAPLRDSH